MAGVSFEENGQRVEMADTTQVRTVSQVPLGEQGTADDGNPFGRIFTHFENGQVFDGADPVEDDFETMLRRDGKARAIEQVLTLPLRWSELTVVPQDGDRGEAALVQEVMTTPANAGGMATPLELVVGQMASAVVYRRAFFEKVFDVQDGRVVYRKLAFRPARTCTLIRSARDRSFRGFRQKVRRGDGASEDVTIRADKAFVYLHGQHRDPLRGSSDMDTVWSCFESKQKVRFLWFQFLERNVIPYGVLKTKEDKATRVREVAKLKSGGVVGLDPDESLDPFEAGGDAAGVFKDAMDWLSAEMSVSVLAGFTDLASQGSGRGSYALSRDQSDFFLRSRQAVLNEMGASLTAWVAADLVRWNFGPDGKAPTIRFGDLADHDAEAARDLWRALAMQAQPNPRVPTEFLDLLTERVAGHLGLDIDKVHRAIEARTTAAASPSEGLRAGIDAAARLVEEAGVAPTG